MKHRISVALTTVVITVGLWFGAHFAQVRMMRSCNAVCNLWEYERVDPFCIIDPVCVSPFYRSGYDGVENWTGVNGWSLPGGQMPAPGDRVLAIPNYVAYMLVSIVSILVTRKYVSSRQKRRLIILALFTWTIVSEAYWFIAASNINGGLTMPILLEAMVTITASLLILMRVAHGNRPFAGK